MDPDLLEPGLVPQRPIKPLFAATELCSVVARVSKTGEVERYYRKVRREDVGVVEWFEGVCADCRCTSATRGGDGVSQTTGHSVYTWVVVHCGGTTYGEQHKAPSDRPDGGKKGRGKKSNYEGGVVFNHRERWNRR